MNHSQEYCSWHNQSSSHATHDVHNLLTPWNTRPTHQWCILSTLGPRALCTETRDRGRHIFSIDPTITVYAPTWQTMLKTEYLPKGSAGGLVRWWAPFPPSFFELCFGQIDINYPLTNINGYQITILDKTNRATFLKNSNFVNNKNILLLIFSPIFQCC